MVSSAIPLIGCTSEKEHQIKSQIQIFSSDTSIRKVGAYQIFQKQYRVYRYQDKLYISCDFSDFEIFNISKAYLTLTVETTHGTLTSDELSCYIYYNQDNSFSITVKIFDFDFSSKIINSSLRIKGLSFAGVMYSSLINWGTNDSCIYDSTLFETISSRYISKLDKSKPLPYVHAKTPLKEEYLPYAWELFDILQAPFTELLSITKECDEYSNNLLPVYSYIECTEMEDLVPFPIACFYDRDFYCAAYAAQFCPILSRNLSDDGELQYIVGVQKKNIELISLLLYLTVSHRGLLHSMNKMQLDVSTVLYNHHPAFKIRSKLNHISKQLGYNEITTKSIPLTASDDSSRKYFAIRATYQSRIFKEISEQKFELYQWSSEYKLFNIISLFFPDTLYQYSTDWLEAQTFDMFIPSIQLAIEYQGIQHYKAVDFFGGDDAFQEYTKRDNSKRQKCKDQHILLLEWHYETPITYYTVLSFLENHGVDALFDKCAVKSRISNVNIESTLALLAPPIINKSIQKKRVQSSKAPSTVVIRQCNNAGVFLAEYDTPEIASRQTSISERAIRKCIYGERKTGGGFLWQRVDRSSDKSDIDALVIEQPVREAKAILQYDLHDKLIAEFPSLRQATNATGVNQRGISDALKGIQKTAGGFYWKYK